MDFLEVDEVDCSICKEISPSKSNLTLDCNHGYHVVCLRQYLRFVRTSKNDPEAIITCPLCRGHVPPEVLEALTNELRILSYKYTLPLYLSRDKNVSVRVAFLREGVERGLEFLTEAMCVRDLPKDPNLPGQVFVQTDLEVTVTDPNTMFRIWTQNAANGTVLSPIFLMKSKSMDDPDEDVEPPVQEIPPDEQRESVPAPPPPILPQPSSSNGNEEAEMRRRRRDPVYIAQRRRQRLANNYRKRLEQIHVMSRRIRKYQESIAKAEAELQRLLGLLDNDVMQMVVNLNNSL